MIQIALSFALFLIFYLLAGNDVVFLNKHFLMFVDDMKPEDVGLSRELQFFKPTNVVKGESRVSYTTVYQCDNFSVRLTMS